MTTTRDPSCPCADCGCPMFRAKYRPNVSRCQACRRQRPMRAPNAKPTIKTPCADCGLMSYGIRCRPCEDRRRSSEANGPRKEHLRWLREHGAPGLGRAQRKRLLRRWMKQRRSCTYCGQPATSIDHVVPLSRGGNNYEGNLTPACGYCNSSKNNRTVMEWREGRPTPATVAVLTARRQREAKRARYVRATPPLPLFSVCAGCGEVHQRASEFCSTNCQSRTAYRRRVGIPDLRPVGRKSA